jgi:PPOX class probable F420-dependent enzyme
MTSAEVEAFLAAASQLTVATVLPDGTPHLVAMSFALVEGAPAFVSYAKSQKVANVRRDPRMTVLAVDGDRYADYRGVQLTGTAEIVERADEVVELMRRIAEHTGGSGPAGDGWREQDFLAQAPKRVGLRLRPQRWLSWDHRKLALLE